MHSRDDSIRRGRFSGLGWEVERCPDARLGDALLPSAVGGAAGYLLALLTRAPGPLRWVALGVGALGGAAASQIHLNLDWDPDRLRGAPEPARDDAPDDDDPPQPL